MVNPKVMEAWFTLMAEAMKGTKEAKEAFESLSKMSGNSEELSRWMSKFMPGSISSTSSLQPEAFEEWLDESWRMMGVVPRSRYLELLEKYDLLQRRLEKAEETIQRLRAMLSDKGQHEDEAKKVVDLWGKMLEDTLRTQTEWMRSWTEANEQPDVSEEDQGYEDTAADEQSGDQ